MESQLRLQLDDSAHDRGMDVVVLVVVVVVFLLFICTK